jgi:4-amino-4-deoxy-L-arabinose transferase-like glycosyltransferase
MVVTDSERYMGLADGLIQTGRFANISQPSQSLIRTPGYPVFLVLVNLVFGDYKWASLLQVLVAFLNCAIIYRIVRDLAAPGAVAFTAMILYLLSLNAAFESVRIMSETITSFWLMLAFWMLVRYRVSRNWYWLAIGGLAMSAGVLTRPALYPLFIIWVLLFAGLSAWIDKRRPWEGPVLRPALIFLISGLLPLLAWQARNYVVHRDFTFSSVGGSTLKNWIVAESMADTYGVSREDAEAMIRTAPNPTSFILDYLRQHPAQVAKDTASGVLQSLIGVDYRSWATMLTGTEIRGSGIVSGLQLTLSPAELLSALAGWGGLAVLALLVDAAMYGMIAVGAWRVFVHRSTTPNALMFFVILLAAVAYTVVVPLGHGSGRFRVPVEPLLALAAGFAFYSPAEAIG